MLSLPTNLELAHTRKIYKHMFGKGVKPMLFWFQKGAILIKLMVSSPTNDWLTHKFCLIYVFYGAAPLVHCRKKFCGGAGSC